MKAYSAFNMLWQTIIYKWSTYRCNYLPKQKYVQIEMGLGENGIKWEWDLINNNNMSGLKTDTGMNSHRHPQTYFPHPHRYFYRENIQQTIHIPHTHTVLLQCHSVQLSLSHCSTVSSIQVIACYLCITFIEPSNFSCVCFTFRPINTH